MTMTEIQTAFRSRSEIDVLAYMDGYAVLVEDLRVNRDGWIQFRRFPFGDWHNMSDEGMIEIAERIESEKGMSIVEWGMKGHN